MEGLFQRRLGMSQASRPSNHLREVLLAAEQNFDVLVQASAAIEAGVDDDALAVVVFAQNVRVDGTETVIAH